MLSFIDSLSRFGILALLVTGCVQIEPWTREKQEAVTTEIIPGATVAQTVRAAENVVKLAGGDNVSFDFRPNGFVGSRRYSAFLVVSAMSGTYTFDFTATPAAGGTLATLRIAQNSTTYTTLGALPDGGSFWDLEGAYNLFFDRVKAQTGNGQWITCSQTKAVYGLVSTHFEPLCLSAQDRTPG